MRSGFMEYVYIDRSVVFKTKYSFNSRKQVSHKKKEPSYNKWLAVVIALLLGAAVVFGVFYVLDKTSAVEPSMYSQLIFSK